MASQKEHVYIKGNLVKDRGIWYVRARVTNPATGEVTHKSKSTGLKISGNNKRKAEEVMREILAEWETAANTCVELGRNPKFGECVEKWLEKKALSIRPNTLHSYEVNANASIIPSLGEICVKDLTRQHIQSYFNALKGKVSVSTMKKHKVVIRGTLEDAVLDGIVQVNVSDRVKLPKKKKFEGHALSEEEVGELLSKIEQEKEPIRAAITFALIYGMRRSEICGLRWQDVDLNAGILHIRNTYTEYSGIQLEEETTKSRASCREIYLVGDTIPYLRDLRAKQQMNGCLSDKVCLHENGKTVRPEYLTRTIRAILVKYGIENVRLHDLRHTAASLLARRLPVKQVQAFLGHEDVSTTLNIYTHIVDADKISTAETMGSILKSCSEICSGNCSGSSKSEEVEPNNEKQKTA